MELKGKKIAFLGDSITEGVGASKPENRFTDVFGRLSGATVYNHGIGGTRIAPQRDNRGEKWDEDFILRADEIERDADAVVIFGGTNDFGHGDAPMGELGDKTNRAQSAGAVRRDDAASPHERGRNNQRARTAEKKACRVRPRDKGCCRVLFFSGAGLVGELGTATARRRYPRKIDARRTAPVRPRTRAYRRKTVQLHEVAVSATPPRRAAFLRGKM